MKYSTDSASAHNDPMDADAMEMSRAQQEQPVDDKRKRLRERRMHGYDETKRRRTTKKAPRTRAARETVAATHLERHRDTGQLRKLIRVGRCVVNRTEGRARPIRQHQGDVYDDIGDSTHLRVGTT